MIKSVVMPRIKKSVFEHVENQFQVLSDSYMIDRCHVNKPEQE